MNWTETDHKEVPESRLGDGKDIDSTFPTRQVGGGNVRKPKPTEDAGMFKRIWERVKGFAVDRAIPFVKRNVDADLSLTRKDRVVTGQVSVTFKGVVLFTLRKSLKL